MTKTLFNRLLCNWGDGWRMDIYASGWWDGNMFTTDIRKFTYMTSPLSPCCSLPFGLIQENRNCRPCWPLSIGVTPWCLLHSSTKNRNSISSISYITVKLFSLIIIEVLVSRTASWPSPWLSVSTKLSHTRLSLSSQNCFFKKWYTLFSFWNIF